MSLSLGGGAGFTRQGVKESKGVVCWEMLNNGFLKEEESPDL